jgi:putative membrane protein
MKTFIFSCIMASLIFSSVHATDSLSARDKKFVMEAAQGGMTEVQLGKLAADKGMSQNVKNFGSKMVTDHGKANDELKSIASSKGITLPENLDSKHQAMIDKMGKKTGAAFDKAYVKAMVADHKEDHSIYSKEASSGKDLEIKNFASKTDRVIKNHLSMIQNIKSKMK